MRKACLPGLGREAHRDHFLAPGQRLGNRVLHVEEHAVLLIGQALLRDHLANKLVLVMEALGAATQTG